MPPIHVTHTSMSERESEQRSLWGSDRQEGREEEKEKETEENGRESGD